MGKTIFNAQVRAEIKEVERHWRSNLIIRLFIITLDIIDSFIFGFIPFPRGFEWYAYIGLGPSIIWTLAVVMFRVFRVSPIHPGVHVGFELVLWIGFICIQVFAYVQVIAYTPWLDDIYEDATIDNVDIFAADVFGCLAFSVLTILHFYLFVRACIDTSRARSHEIATRAAAIAAQMMKNMESRGTFYRRDSEASYGYRPFEADEEGHIFGLEAIHHSNNNNNNNDTGLAPLQSSAMSHISHGARSSRTQRTGRTRVSEARTQYTHTRSLSVPIPTSPRSLRTAKTDEPSFFRLDR